MRHKSILVVLALLFLTDAASARTRHVECHVSRDDSNHWMWRKVDGRRCWYEGRHRIGKSRLFWSGEKHDRPKHVSDHAAFARIGNNNTDVVGKSRWNEWNEIDALALSEEIPLKPLGKPVVTSNDVWGGNPVRPVKTIVYRAGDVEPRLPDWGRQMVSVFFVVFAALIALYIVGIYHDVEWRQLCGSSLLLRLPLSLHKACMSTAAKAAKFVNTKAATIWRSTTAR